MTFDYTYKLMSTVLGKTTSFVRKSIFGTIVLFFVVTILQIFTGFLDGPLGIVTTRPTQPPNLDKCAVANNTFGKIPSLKIPSLTLATGTNAKFSSDKPSKEFPQFPSALNVYKLDKIIEGLGDVDKARATAVSLGFPEFGGVTTQEIIRWQSADERRVFSFDKTTHIWELTSNYGSSNYSMLNASFSTYPSVAQLILRNIQTSESNYSNPDIEYDYILRKFDRSFESVTQISKGNILKMKFFKVLDIAECKDSSDKKVPIPAKVYAPEYKDQSYTASVTGQGIDLTKDLISFNLREVKLSKTNGVYTSKTMDEAFLDLQNNKGVLYWILLEGNNSYGTYKELNIEMFEIAVAKTSLVYVEPQKYIDNDESTFYIQPFFRFEGKAKTTDGKIADFIFLVPALKADSYS